MKMLPSNALEGARRAYFAKHSERTDEHWEKWLKFHICDWQGRVQNYLELATLCEDALEFHADRLDPSVLKHVQASQAYYRKRADRMGY